ncbi:MAG: sodium ion-translocating decarboxylase subunit beta [bacterium]|nr:sodium ion-translocating decarboxylase subunit beta [bacterium]
MLGIGLVLIYLAIKRGYEPFLLIPIGFGIILGNVPAAGLMNPPLDGAPGGVLWYLFQGVKLAIYPPLIFLGIGALTDFGPLIASPVNMLLGAAAQFGIFGALLGSIALGFTLPEAASIGIIGGADGPTAIFLTTKLAPHLLGPIAVAAYSYIALVPIIQPPVIRALTTPRERAVVMKQLRPVGRTERVLFPIVVTLMVGLLVPSALPLVGMLMLGNLFREAGVVERLSRTTQNQFIDVVTIFLALTIGASAGAETFFTWQFIGILILGLIAFAVSTAAGVLAGKLACWLTGGRVNPLIGAAGVSAVPAAARVAQKLGAEANPGNFLLMHAMGPNVAGVIGSAVAAGVLWALLG